jgi:hypothetical protein
MSKFEKYFVIGISSLILAPGLWVTSNILKAQSNLQKEYNLLTKLPENNRLVESYRLFNGPIMPLLYQAAENKVKELEKKKGITRIITSPQKFWLKDKFSPFIYLNE